MQRIELGEKIQSDVQDEISKSQKEYYLREQLKAIQKELGEIGDEGNDLESLLNKIKSTGLNAEAEEISKMEHIPVDVYKTRIQDGFLWVAMETK